MFGACHLLVHFYLVGRLEPTLYGAFALAMVWGLLGASVHQAFLVEPLLVARSTSLGRESGYLRAVLRLHWVVSGAGALLLAGISRLPGVWATLGPELLGTASFVMGVTGVRLVRSMAYVELPPRAGTLAVVGYALLTTLGVAATAHLRVISGPIVLGVMGAAGALAASIALARERLAPSGSGLTRRAFALHWQHGRWLLLLAPFRWGLDSLPLVILGSVRGLAELALLRAAVLVAAPAVQVVGAVRMMLIPRFVDALERRTLGRLLVRAQLALALGTSAFALVVSAEARPLLELVLPRYVVSTRLLPLISLTPALLGAALVFGNVLRAAGRPELSTTAFAVASVVASVAAYPLCMREGAWGAALSLVIGYATLLFCKAGLALRAARSSDPRA